MSLKSEEMILWRGVPMLLEGKVDKDRIYPMLFKPALQALWEDFQANKIPAAGVRVTLSYTVDKITE